MNRLMKMWSTLTILIVMALAITGCTEAKQVSQTDNNTAKEDKQTDTPSSTENEEKSTETLDNVQDFTLKDIDGNDVSLSQFRGKNVYLNFWSTTCKSCVKEVTAIEKIYQDTRDTDTIVLTVSFDENKDTVKEFMKNNSYNFTVLTDTSKSLKKINNITRTPTSYFIDKKGNTVSKKVGAITLDEMKQELEKLN